MFGVMTTEIDLHLHQNAQPPYTESGNQFESRGRTVTRVTIRLPQTHRSEADRLDIYADDPAQIVALAHALLSGVAAATAAEPALAGVR